jgi:hypothetical protein
MKTQYQQRWAQLEAAGFLFQSDIFNSKDEIEGAVFTCKTEGSAFNGEIVDLYTNGEVVQTHGIKGKKPLFRFGIF